MPEKVSTTAYADDLMVVVATIAPEETEHKANTAFDRVLHSMKEKSLALASETSGAILLIDRRRCRKISHFRW